MWSEGGFQHASPGFGSSQPDTSMKGRSRSGALMPVTIAQIFQAEQMEDAFVLENKKELTTVTLVAIVRSVKDSPQRFDYKVDDLSGPWLDVRQYVDQEDDMPEELRPRPVTENTYVRVYGNLRQFNGQRNVTAFKVVPITDMNELTNHILDTIYAHMLVMTHEKKLKVAMEHSGMPGKTPTALSVSYAGGVGSDSADMSQLQRQVMNIINSFNKEEGASVQYIKECIKSVNEKVLRQAIELLSNDGHIYSTIDDDHYKCTDV